VRQLAANVDVVVQHFRPGVVDRLGVGYHDIRAINPSVVYVSLSGFGSQGPYRERSAYDTVIQAYAGLASGSSETGMTARSMMTASRDRAALS
jgi:crotonobetainyl-CoA:carnitine CoA-transferase CaiB-like acyl-CoA transferase